jgi:glycosyltransferase involved in cell wall biosynthesis
VSSIRAGLAELLADTGLRERMRAAGRRRAAAFSWEATAAATVATLERAAA